MLQLFPCVNSRLDVANQRRLSTHDSTAKEYFNEPRGYQFGRIPGKKYPPNWPLRIYIFGFLGSTALFVFLYQYKPDVDPSTWGRKEALRRMKERGVDIESYRYKPPNVY